MILILDFTRIIQKNRKKLYYIYGEEGVEKKHDHVVENKQIKSNQVELMMWVCKRLPKIKAKYIMNRETDRQSKTEEINQYM